MYITVNRASVCMGDDVLDHKIKINLPDDASYEDLYNELKKLSYFPYVSGNNVVWVLSNKEYDCIFSYFTYDNTFSAGLSETLLSNIDDGTHSYYLSYFSSPEKWKEYFYSGYNNNEKDLYHDGWGDEIKHCNELAGKSMEYKVTHKSIKNYFQGFFRRLKLLIHGD